MKTFKEFLNEGTTSEIDKLYNKLRKHTTVKKYLRYTKGNLILNKDYAFNYNAQQRRKEGQNYHIGFKKHLNNIRWAEITIKIDEGKMYLFGELYSNNGDSKKYRLRSPDKDGIEPIIDMLENFINDFKNDKVRSTSINGYSKYSTQSV